MGKFNFKSTFAGVLATTLLSSSLNAYGIVDTPPKAPLADAKKQPEAIEIKVEQNIFNRTFEKKFDTGPIKDIKLIGGTIGWYLLNRVNGSHDVKEKIDNNLPLFGTNGHFRDGTKFQFTWLPWYKIKNYEKQRHRIWQYFVQKELNEHVKITVGQDRVPTGVEGSLSMFSLPTGRRALIAKQYNNVCAIGVRFDGKWDNFEYKAGLFDTGRQLKNTFKEPPEFAGLAFFKPIKNTDKYGNLKIGGGYSTGKLQHNYAVYTFYTAYDYKKWHMDYEYNYADGYNAYVNTSDKSYGWYNTLAYKLNKKVHLFTRYQGLDPNKEVQSDHKRMYEAGVNYYMRGKKLRLTASYGHVNSRSGADSNQLFVSTQVMF